MLWMLPVAGALGGALLNKKDPLQGAAMGGLLGAGGMAAAPSIMGAIGGTGLSAGTQAALGSAGVNAGSQQAAMLAAQEAGMGGGLLDSLKTASTYAAPIAQAAGAAGSIKGLLSDPQMQAPQMMPTQNTGAQSLAGLAQSGQQQIDQLMSEDMKRRMANQQIIQSMMGRNYG